MTSHNYAQALNIAREIGDKVLEAGILGSLGEEHMALADRPKALDCFERALQIFDSLSHRQGRASALADLAEGKPDSSFIPYP